eukprot:1207797-Prymnesium_polylepis.3
MGVSACVLEACVLVGSDVQLLERQVCERSQSSGACGLPSLRSSEFSHDQRSGRPGVDTGETTGAQRHATEHPKWGRAPPTRRSP